MDIITIIILLITGIIVAIHSISLGKAVAKHEDISLLYSGILSFIFGYIMGTAAGIIIEALKLTIN